MPTPSITPNQAQTTFNSLADSSGASRQPSRLAPQPTTGVLAGVQVVSLSVGSKPSCEQLNELAVNTTSADALIGTLVCISESLQNKAISKGQAQQYANTAVYSAFNEITAYPTEVGSQAHSIKLHEIGKIAQLVDRCESKNFDFLENGLIAHLQARLNARQDSEQKPIAIQRSDSSGSVGSLATVDEHKDDLSASIKYLDANKPALVRHFDKKLLKAVAQEINQPGTTSLTQSIPTRKSKTATALDIAVQYGRTEAVEAIGEYFDGKAQSNHHASYTQALSKASEREGLYNKEIRVIQTEKAN